MGFAFLSGRGWEGCLWTENLLYLYSKTTQRTCAKALVEGRPRAERVGYLRWGGDGEAVQPEK
jgi:hypothetical protein